MTYAWLETSLLVLIFVVAALFAVKHFLPGFIHDSWRFLNRKNNRAIDIRLVATTDAGSCRTTCSACNGCALASKH